MIEREAARLEMEHQLAEAEAQRAAEAAAAAAVGAPLLLYLIRPQIQTPWRVSKRFSTSVLTTWIVCWQKSVQREKN